MLKMRWSILTVLMLIIFNTYAGGPDLGPAVKTGQFNQLTVDGYIDVVIRGGAQTHLSSVNGVQAKIRGKTLYITPTWRVLSGKRPLMVITLPDLTSLTVSGAANVSGINIHSRGLSIQSSGSGKIKLIGMMKINQIDQIGNNRIYLRWINSNHLFIDSDGEGLIYLGGRAQVLYARLTNHAVLNAQYLRTSIVQVQTKNDATALVYPVTTLRAFATNNANIYYYKYPKNMTRDSTESGNVLQMAWRP